MKIVPENGFSGKTYCYTIASSRARSGPSGTRGSPRNARPQLQGISPEAEGAAAVVATEAEEGATGAAADGAAPWEEEEGAPPLRSPPPTEPLAAEARREGAESAERHGVFELRLC